MGKLTRKDLKFFKVFNTGYGTIQNIARSELVEKLGYNCGLYGWNWTAYRVKGTNTVLLDSYRNGLAEWFDNFSAIRSQLEELDQRCNYMYKKTDEEKAAILKELQDLLNLDNCTK